VGVPKKKPPGFLGTSRVSEPWSEDRIRSSWQWRLVFC